MAIPLKQRALAGLWFMAAATLIVLPIAPTVVPFHSESVAFVIWMLLSPLLVSGLVGSLLGASILDAQKVRSGWRAALRGLLVSVMAYLLFAILFSIWEGANHLSLSFREAFAQMFFWIMAAGVIFFGWVVAIVGALAGWILHLIAAAREKRTA